MKPWQVGAVLGAGLVLGALGMRVAPLLLTEVEKPAAAPADSDGNGIQVSAEVQKQAGLRVATIGERQLAGSADGYAHALDPAPLGALASEIVAATAAHDGSAKELARLTALVAADAGASRHDLDAARAQEGQDRARLTLACQQPTLQFGQGLGRLGCEAMPGLAQRVARGEVAILRLDFPDGPPPIGSTVTIDLGSGSAPVRVLGPAIAGDTQLQTAGVLALFEGPRAAFAGVGRIMSAHRATGPGRAGLVIPREAVVRADGAVQVYRQIAPDRFERIGFDGEPVDGGWFVAEGGALKPGDHVVVSGAGTLLGLERAAGTGAGQGGDD